MPLEKCRKGDKKCASRNIAKERAAGKPRKQAVAIGLKSAKISRGKSASKRTSSAKPGGKKRSSTASSKRSSGGKLTGWI